jgi:hypothetical protein
LQPEIRVGVEGCMGNPKLILWTILGWINSLGWLHSLWKNYKTLSHSFYVGLVAQR